MEKIIRTIRRYEGSAHAGLRGQRVVLLAVHRGYEILEADDTIEPLRQGDRIEFAPLIGEADGSKRVSWVASDGDPDEFGRIEAWFEGPVASGIVVSAASNAIDHRSDNGPNTTM